jgi:RNA polymerase sigma factor (sigma-70 family)
VRLHGVTSPSTTRALGTGIDDAGRLRGSQLPSGTRSYVDPVGLHELYRDEYRALVRLACSLVSSVATAEDLVQETFIAAHLHWSTVRDAESQGAWLRHVLLNKIRSRGRRQRLEEATLAHLGRRDQRTHHVGPTSLADELTSALQRLPRRQAQVFVLRTLEDRSFEEIGKILHIKPTSSRTSYLQARRRLAAHFSDGRTHDDERPRP